MADQVIEASDGGIGFVCVAPAVGEAQALAAFARAVLTLLHALAPSRTRNRAGSRAAGRRPGPLLHGGGAYPRLSDAGLVKAVPAAAPGAPAAGSGSRRGLQDPRNGA